MRGKRLRAALRDLRVDRRAPATADASSVNVDLQPRTGSLTELNVIGCTVDEALDPRSRSSSTRSTVTDQHDCASSTATAPASCAARSRRSSRSIRWSRGSSRAAEQGGGGATVVELKD